MKLKLHASGRNRGVAADILHPRDARAAFHKGQCKASGRSTVLQCSSVALLITDKQDRVATDPGIRAVDLSRKTSEEMILGAQTLQAQVISRY